MQLGRLDIACEVSIVVSMMALLREGHIDQLFHIITYLRHKYNAESVLDPTVPDIDEQEFFVKIILIPFLSR